VIDRRRFGLPADPLPYSYPGGGPQPCSDYAVPWQPGQIMGLAKAQQQELYLAGE
jgi:hypothetical protein